MYLQEDVCWLEVLLLVRTMVEVRIAVAVAVARLAAWRATVREPEARLPVVAGFSAVRAAAIVPCVSSKHMLAVVSPATPHPPSARPREKPTVATKKGTSFYAYEKTEGSVVACYVDIAGILSRGWCRKRVLC